MNIAFDSIALLSPTSKNRGIGNYAFSQLREIIRQDRGNNYFFFNIYGQTDIFEKEIEEGILQQDDFFCLDNDMFFLQSMLEAYGALVKQYIENNKIDIFYITSPFDGHVPVYQREWFQGITVIAIVYDIIPYVMKERYLSQETDMQWYMERVNMLRWMDQLLVISQSVKDDLMHYLNFQNDNIEVVWGAPGDLFRRCSITESTRRKLLRKYEIDSPYIMCTGGDDERKNIAGLIEAFGKLPEKLKMQYQLVVVCKLQSVSVKRYSKLAESVNAKGRVVFTNFVTDEELVQFYNLAELVAFPSTYEGFGLPVVEAWACGTPVLTSNNSSLVQIAGDAAVLVDPFSVDSIAKGLEDALTRSDLDRLARAGMQRLEKFQWPVVAQETINSFYRVKKRADKDSAEISRCRIAFFTPLPPMKSGISDYSVDILRILSKQFDIDVFIDDGYKADCILPENVEIYQHREYRARKDFYDDTVYQIGNSDYHVYMWPYLKQYKGTIVLHDYNLNGIAEYVAYYMGKTDTAFYRSALLEDMSAEEAEACIKSIACGIAHTKEVNGFITNYANKIIVHSRESKEKLLQKNIGRNVSWIRSYAKIEPFIDRVSARNKMGIPLEITMLAAFGHIHETKRVLPILHAFARVLKKFKDIRLDFVGKLDAGIEKQFKNTVHELGIEEKVTVTGYTALDEFTDYIDAADICLNLRWPYNGETSGSLMRILSKGKCVIVNDIGSFSEIPDAACVKIPSAENMSEKQEIQTICSAIESVLKDDKRRGEIQKCARKFAEENLDIEKIAVQYAECILKPPCRVVTENLLESLKQEIREKQLSDKHIKMVSHTLAYVK